MTAADVLVVGGGGAGLAAAIEAAALGRSVILFEKEPALGGSTAWSVGSISVTNSRHQRRLGIQDSPDEHFEDLGRLAGDLAGRDNLHLRRLLVDNITQTFEWLESMGLVFAGPSDEPPHRHPRMHNVLPGSRAFPARLGRRARRLGVGIRLGWRVERLRMTDGRVTGLAAAGPRGGPAEFAARRGVVLAGGDYSANRDLLAELASPLAAGAAPVNPAATGDGLLLGRAAGGRIVNGDLVRGPVLRFVPPPRRPLVDRLPAWPALAVAMRAGYERLPGPLVRPFLMRFLTTALGLSPALLEAGAILVNRDGVRFGNGDGDAAAQTSLQPGGLAWVVFDARIARRFTAWPHFVSTAPGIAYAYLDDYRRTRPDIFAEAADPAALAARAGLPRAALAQALAGAGLDAAPCFALGPVRAYVAFTEGGLAVSERLEVLDAGDRPIARLYAAGSNGQGGALLEGHGHHLGWAFVSGRLAGRAAALQPPLASGAGASPGPASCSGRPPRA